MTASNLSFLTFFFFVIFSTICMKPRGRINLSRWIIPPSVSINGGYGTTKPQLLFLLLLLLLLLNGGGLPVGMAQTTPGMTKPAGSQTGKSFTLKLEILLIVLLSVLLCLGFCSVCIRYLAERAMAIDDGNSGDWLSLSQDARGLHASVIETFPTFCFSALKTLRIGKEAHECPVCLNEFHDDETLRLIPHCCHVFHPHCIDAWLRYRATCPVCRTSLVLAPSESFSLETLDPDSESAHGFPDWRRVMGSPEARLIDSVTWTNRMMPRRSWSTGRLSGFISRSEPTSTSVRDERFTLRLTQGGHEQLMSSSLQSQVANIHVALPQAWSPVRGYRSRSIGSERNHFDGVVRLDRWPFSITPPHRTSGSIRSTGGCDQVRAGAPEDILLALRSPLNPLTSGKNDADEDHSRSKYTSHDQNQVL